MTYRVMKDEKVLSEHKYSGQAIEAAKEVNASHVHYLNDRGYGTVVWDAAWNSSAKPTPKSEGGYL